MVRMQIANVLIPSNIFGGTRLWEYSSTDLPWQFHDLRWHAAGLMMAEWVPNIIMSNKLYDAYKSSYLRYLCRLSKSLSVTA